MWLIPTRNRPEAMQELIVAMGYVRDVAVMVDGEPYDIEWPAHWRIHYSTEHLEMQRGINALFKLYPNEKTYGLITDHARPQSANWADELDKTAGDWKIALCSDTKDRFNHRTGHRRMTAAVSIGGNLARACGYVWPDFCTHLYGDDALEEIGWELGLVEYREDVIVKDLHFIHGEFKRDKNHDRMYQGRSYLFDDRKGYFDWRSNKKPALLDKIAGLTGAKRIPSITICCVQAGNYQGRGADYVMRLYDMILRNMPKGIAFKFICFTDEPGDLDIAIEDRPLPEPLDGWWNKLALFKRGVFNEGEQVFFFDLDTLVIGSLDDVFSYTGDFCMLRDFYRPEGKGSGLMSWKPEQAYAIWYEWLSARMPKTDGGDQTWIENYECDTWQDRFPGAVVSYKAHCLPYPPNGASVVCFHGLPRPHECTQKWVQDCWKVGGAGRLNLSLTVNTDVNKILENVWTNRESAPWICSSQEHKVEAMIVGTGPSLLDTMECIRDYVKQGGVVFALNNAAAILKANCIPSYYQVILDARPDNVKFIGHAGTYLLGSQCDPSLFEKAKGRVLQWHPVIEGLPELFPEAPITLIGGGTTVGLSAMALAYAMGYRTMHLFGYDSSFRVIPSSSGPDPEWAGYERIEIGGIQTHAAYQERNAAERQAFDVTVNETTFQTNAAMAKQAELFPQFADQLAAIGVSIKIYGDGLLPFIAQTLCSAPAQIHHMEPENEHACI